MTLLLSRNVFHARVSAPNRPTALLRVVLLINSDDVATLSASADGVLREVLQSIQTHAAALLPASLVAASPLSGKEAIIEAEGDLVYVTMSVRPVAASYAVMSFEDTTTSPVGLHPEPLASVEVVVSAQSIARKHARDKEKHKGDLTAYLHHGKGTEELHAGSAAAPKGKGGKRAGAASATAALTSGSLAAAATVTPAAPEFAATSAAASAQVKAKSSSAGVVVAVDMDDEEGK